MMKILAPVVLLLCMLLTPDVAGSDSAVSASFVYRPPKFDLHFNHALHMDEAECEECHKQDPSDGKFMALPDHEICVDCHETSEEVPFSKDRECDTCHTQNDITTGTIFGRSLLQVPAARLNFSHQVHINKKVACLTCHKDIPDTDLDQTSTLPDMETCEACHASTKEPDQCSTCHLLAPNGRLLTQDGTARFKPVGQDRVDSHNAKWSMNHSTVAFAKSTECLSCHTETYCTRCHTTKAIRFVHPVNWITAHGARSGMQQYRCATCHTAQGFCKDCHQRSKLAGALPGSPGLRGKYHPEGWMQKSVSGSFHGVRARMQTTTCASCHSEQSCIRCHGSSGKNRGGISPHPANFSTQRLKRRAGGSCLKCHSARDPNLR